MNSEEPNLLTHINEVRSKYIPEGGVSSVIFCGRTETDSAAVLKVHREIVESQVNNKSGSITGILIGQVQISLTFITFFFLNPQFYFNCDSPGKQHLASAGGPK